MCSLKFTNSEKFSRQMNIPKPPKEIELILDEYQNFLGSVFSREYEMCSANETMSMNHPKLSIEEQKYMEDLTTKLHTCRGWKAYIKQCVQWAVMMCL